jgi:hypothetical protein
MRAGLCEVEEPEAIDKAQDGHCRGDCGIRNRMKIRIRIKNRIRIRIRIKNRIKIKNAEGRFRPALEVASLAFRGPPVRNG